MRVLLVVPLLVIAWQLPATALAAGGRDAPPALASVAPPKPEATMDQLFATLADRKDETAGKAAEDEIERRWLHSGSDTIDLLMSWATEALAAKNYAGALDYLDAVTMLKPDFAEGWNRRATIFYLQDDYGKAIADLEKVLALEPRHFGALAGLGLILRDIDRKADALSAFERAVALDPYLDGDIKDSIEELKHDVEGRAI